ncbi:MAG: spore germination protein [Eubacterium sp.]
MPYKFISPEVVQTIKNIDRELYIGESFDLLKKNIVVAERKACVYFINGFCKEDVMEKLQEFFSSIKKEDMPDDAEQFCDKMITYIEADTETDKEEIITNILSGVVCLVIDGYDKAFLIDVRTYPTRGIEEPEKYKVLRGSRDGFVETLVSNTALIRRRIRSPQFFVKIYRVGKSSRTDVAICYMDDRVDRKLLKDIETKLKNVRIDSLTMNQESLAECLHKGSWINPLPKFRYSERPDTVAAQLLEGNIAILVDNSPAAMILPTTIFDVIEEADDYYFPPITGTYLRFTRFSVTVLSLLMTPVFMLMMQNPNLIPPGMEFIIVRETVYVPIIWQFLILEVAIDGLKLAAINTPNMLNTPLSLIAALIIGEFAVNTGWFNQEPMLYMAAVAIANFTHENFEFGYAVKFMRIILLILTALFNVWGFVLGLVITLVFIIMNKTIAGGSYIYPLIPFNAKIMLHRFLRVDIKQKK